MDMDCPNAKKISVKPVSDEINLIDFIFCEDRNIMAECKALATEFVATNKVLKKLA